MTEEVIGKFAVERTPAKYGGYRTVVIDEGGKQVGSTFDDDVGDRLAGYPEGADIAVDVDKSGRFWEVVDARLANGSQPTATNAPRDTTPREAAPAPAAAAPSQAAAPAPSQAVKAPKAGSYGSDVPFSERDLTYFMGNSARVIAAYLKSSKEYVDQIENTKNPIETLHKDIAYGAKLLLNEANRKG